MTELTICILTTTRKRSLLTCLRSLKKTDTPFNLIVVREPGSLKPKHIHNLYPEALVLDFKNGLIGAKKQLYHNHVDTRYYMKLDDDMVAHPGAVDHLVHCIKTKLGQVSVSGIALRDGEKPTYSGHADFRRLGEYLLLDQISTDFLLHGPSIWPCSFPLEGCTVYKTDQVEYDPGFEVGYSHWDTCYRLHLLEKPQLVAPSALFDHRHNAEPEYRNFHRNKRLKLIRKSRQKFIEKWSLTPVDSHSRRLAGKALYLAQRAAQTIRQPSQGPLAERLGNYLGHQWRMT